MGSRDRVSALVLLILSVAVCLGAADYGLGDFHSPGTGFFPFLLGAFIGILSLLMLARAKSERRERVGEKTLRAKGGGQRKVFCILLALVAYALLLERLGYTPTTFLLFVILLRGIQPQRWPVAIGAALFGSLGSYSLFQLALHVELPRGLLGM